MEEDPFLAVTDTSCAALQPFLEAAQEISMTVTNSKNDASNNTNKNNNNAVATARALLLKVLSHPEITYGFDELKALLSPVLQLHGNAGVKMLRTLDLFAYGTYADYTASQSHAHATSTSATTHDSSEDKNSYFMPLSEAHLYKLRQLTVISLVQAACERKQNFVSYASVHETLQLTPTETTMNDPNPNRPVIEDILIACMYTGALHGKLCQKRGGLIVSAHHHHRGTYPVRSRDVHHPHRVPFLLQRLYALQANIQAVLLTAAQDADATSPMEMKSVRILGVDDGHNEDKSSHNMDPGRSGSSDLSASKQQHQQHQQQQQQQQHQQQQQQHQQQQQQQSIAMESLMNTDSSSKLNSGVDSAAAELLLLPPPPSHSNQNTANLLEDESTGTHVVSENNEGGGDGSACASHRQKRSRGGLVGGGGGIVEEMVEGGSAPVD